MTVDLELAMALSSVEALRSEVAELRSAHVRMTAKYQELADDIYKAARVSSTLPAARRVVKGLGNALWDLQAAARRVQELAEGHELPPDLQAAIEQLADHAPLLPGGVR